MNTFLIFLLFILISLSHTQPKTFNDTKCDLFGSMLLKHFISKEPYSSNFTDMYKLLQSSGTAIGDLGNYYECQKISYAKYFVLTAELSVMNKITLLLLCLLSQNVTVVSMCSLNLTCTGETESLLRSGICLYFWHFFKF